MPGHARPLPFNAPTDPFVSCPSGPAEAIPTLPPHRKLRMRTQQGFTLIELMITVAIIAILSAIAIPQYSQYVMRSRITEATLTLSDQRLKMERFFQDNRSFIPVGLPQACTAGTVAPPPQPTAHFNYNCAVTSPNNYLITATGFGTMANFVYTVDDANVRATTGVPPGWVLAPACWALKKDGSC